MKLVERRVLPSQTKSVKSDLASMLKQISGGNPINLGDRGPAVAALQRHLAATGIYTGPVSGTFDAATDFAVKALEKRLGVTQDGAVDKAELAALKKSTVYVKDGFDTSAHAGQAGSDIKRAENLLEKLGFRPGKADGIFDAATQKAVERYRKADPQVSDKGSAINSKLFDELKKAAKGYDHGPLRRREVENSKGLKQHTRLDDLTAKLAAKGDGLGVGDEGRAVLNVEKHLEAAGYELGKPNAKFGSRTEAAVKAFQRASSLPETGTVDSKTWAKLRGTLFAAESATSPAQRVGERDGSVKATERKLKELGFNVGKVDGYFTSATEKAVERFQKKNKLNVTGKVGDGTLKAIDRKLAAAEGPFKPQGKGMIRGSDTSHYQSQATFEQAIRGAKWAAIKATQGTGYTDPAFKSRWAELGKKVASGQMKLRMAYLFLDAGNGVGQAKHFLDTLGIKGPLKPGTRLALDWEASALSSPSTLRDAANYIHKVTGIWPVVYTSASRIAQARAAVPKATLWEAKWSSTIAKDQPFVQYSDGPGYDHDVFNGSLKDLERFAGFSV